MKVLADTNILARLAQPSHQHHSMVIEALAALRSRGDQACIVPQVLYEFWSVATRPAAQNGLGFSVQEAVAEVEELKALFQLLRDERAIFQNWERLVELYDVKGKSAHDARLVAAMLRHGLTQIMTFNAGGFARYAGIIVVIPQTVTASNSQRGL